MTATAELTTGSDRLRKDAMRHGAGDAEAGLEKRGAHEVAELVGAAGLDASAREAVYEAYSTSFDSICKREVLVDAASAMSFPASDPPSYMGGASVAGAPDTHTPAEKVTTKVSDKDEVAPLVPDPGAADKQTG